MVRVRLHGAARRLSAQAETSLDVESVTTVGQVLRRLSPEFDRIAPQVASAILINGRNCAFSGGLGAAVKDGDLIEVLPVVTGG